MSQSLTQKHKLEIKEQMWLALTEPSSRSSHEKAVIILTKDWIWEDYWLDKTIELKK